MAAFGSAKGLQSVDGDVMARLLADSQSAVVASIYGKCNDFVAKTAGRVMEVKGVVKVPWYLCPADLAVLQDVLPVFKFAMTNMPSAAVSLMEAFRYAMIEVFAHIDSWPGERVIHLNGGIVSSALRSRSYVHSCIDISDSAQHTEFLNGFNILRRMRTQLAKKKVGLADEFCARGSDDCEFYCSDPVNCALPACSVWIDHCETDMPLVQLAHVMSQHDAIRAFGSIVYNPDMLVNDTGRLDTLKAEWFVDRKTDTLTVVSLTHRDTVWRHSYKSWLQIVTQAGLYTQGFQYTWEVVAHYGDFLVYRFSKQLEIPEQDTLLRFKRWDSGRENKVKLTSWFLTDGKDPTVRDSWYSRSCEWPIELYHRVSKKAISMEVGSFSVESLRRHLRDYNSTCITSGSVVSAPKFKVYGVDADIGIVTIYNMCFKSRFEAGKATQLMRSACATVNSLKRKGLVNLAWLLAIEYVRTGIDISLEKFCFLREDFPVAPTAEYLTGYKIYETFIPKKGMHPESLFEWRSTVNSGFSFPKVVSGRNMLEVLRLSRTKMRTVSSSDSSDGGVKLSEASSSSNSVEDRSTAKGMLTAISASVSRNTVSNGSTTVVVSVNSVGTSVAACSSSKLMERYISKSVSCVPVVVVGADVNVDVKPCSEAVSNKLIEVYDLQPGGALAFERVGLDNVVEEVSDDDNCQVDGLIYDIQDVMDQMYPGMSAVPMSNRTGILHTTDQSIVVSAHHNAINVGKMTLPPPTWVVDSKLRTPVEGDRPQTGLETMVAFNKRNNDTPYLRDPTDPLVAAQSMWDYLESGGFFRDDYKELLAGWNSEFGKVRFTVDESNAWLNRAAGSTILELLACDISGLSDAVINVYNLMLKAQVKAKLDGQAVGSEYSPLQTVVYHKKSVNALFSPIFSVITRRLCELLHPKIVIQMRKSPKEMQEAIRVLIAAGGGYEGIRNFEADQSKYDKSQDQVALELEKLVYTKLGMDTNLLEVWTHACAYGEISSVSAGFRAFVAYQRKSGTATTTLGNTALNIFSVITAFKLKMEDIVYAVFLGDDSLVGYRGTPLDLRAGIDYMSSVVNLQVKAYDTEVGYICSQYLVPDGKGNAVLMSDPVKRMAVLGRPVKVAPDVLSRRYKEKGVPVRAITDEVREKWVSFSDLLMNYGNAYCRESLDKCVSMRVDTRGSILRGIEALSCLRVDFDKFKEIYSDDPVRVVI